jgi:hypothetical protein
MEPYRPIRLLIRTISPRILIITKLRQIITMIHALRVHAKNESDENSRYGGQCTNELVMGEKGNRW